MLLPITLTFAGAAAVLNLWLALRTSAQRITGKHMIGDGGDTAMLARMRAHANFTEYAPFALILVGGIELAGGWPMGLWIAVVAFLLARLAHPFGMDRAAPNPFRAGGIFATWLVLAVLAGWALYLVAAAPTRVRPGSAIELAPPKA